MFALFIVYGGTIPFDFTLTPAAARERLHALPLNPLISPDTHRRVSIPDVAQNVALFVPFGMLGLLALRQRRSPSVAVASVVALGAVLSATVETIQLFEPDRTASFADICWNIAGTAAGAIALVAVTAIARPWLARVDARRLLAAPAFYPLAVAIVVLALAAWEPFDFTLDVGSLIGKLRALHSDIWQLGAVRDEGVELLRYAMFGLALAIWLRQLEVRRAAWIAAASAATFACALEASQWIVFSRMPGLEDALVHAGGGAVGAALSNGWPHGRSPRFWWAVLWIATTVAVALQLFASAARTTGSEPITLETVSEVFELALMYVPLGYVSATAFDCRRAYLAATGAAASTAIVLGRADIIDGIVAVFGALAGCFAGTARPRDR